MVLDGLIDCEKLLFHLLKSMYRKMNVA